MSITEPTADGVQPGAGQGDGGQTESQQPYADFLNRVPEEVRGDVEPIFADWNSKVNGRFEEAANYRKQWEPFEQIGVHQQNPEQLKALLEFQQAVDQNPQGVWDWAQQYARERGLLTESTPSEDSTQLDPSFGFEDPNQQLQKLLEEKLGPVQSQLKEFSQWREQLQQQAHEQQISQQLASEVERLKAEHAKDLPKDVQENFEDIIERFGLKYAEPGADPKSVVDRAWADFQSLAGQLQTAALQQKVDQPEPAESGGTPDLTPEKIDSLRDAGRIALEQLRANRAA